MTMNISTGGARPRSGNPGLISWRCDHLSYHISHLRTYKIDSRTSEGKIGSEKDPNTASVMFGIGSGGPSTNGFEEVPDHIFHLNNLLVEMKS